MNTYIYWAFFSKNEFILWHSLQIDKVPELVKLKTVRVNIWCFKQSFVNVLLNLSNEYHKILLFIVHE